MNEQVQRIINHPATKPVVYVAVGFLAGLNVGYLLGRRNRRVLSPPLEELEKISKEVAAIKARREAREANKPPVVVEEEVVVVGKKAGDIVADVAGDVVSAFADGSEEWDYEEEKKTRDSLAPYVIHKDEFWSDEKNFDQHTWTFYEGDDVMIDEDDVIIYNHDQKLGELKFGHGSGDKDTVYIRNEKLRLEVEVLRDLGMYSIEVLGMEVDHGDEKNVEHSMKKDKRGKKDERST